MSPELAEICSEIEERLSLSACDWDSSSSSVAWRAAWASFSSAKRASASALGRGDFFLLGGDRVAGALDLRPHGGHSLDRRLRFVAQPLDPAGDRVVVRLDPVQVPGARVELRPARRFEHRVEHVGVARLVDRDQAFAQDAEGAVQPFADVRQVLLVLFQFRGRGFQFALLFGEFGLDRRLLLAQRRDFADHRVDFVVLFGDRSRSARFRSGARGRACPASLRTFLRGPWPGRWRRRSASAITSATRSRSRGAEERGAWSFPGRGTNIGARRLLKSPKNVSELLITCNFACRNRPSAGEKAATTTIATAFSIRPGRPRGPVEPLGEQFAPSPARTPRRRSRPFLSGR